MKVYAQLVNPNTEHEQYNLYEISNNEYHYLGYLHIVEYSDNSIDNMIKTKYSDISTIT
jgi:hypothetical protein